MNLKLSQNDFNRLATVVFHRALEDVNDVIHSHNILLEPSDVSCASFLDYVSANHRGLSQCDSIELLTMRIYQTAVNDILFQASEHQFSLGDITARRQLNSCELSLQVCFGQEYEAELSVSA